MQTALIALFLLLQVMPMQAQDEPRQSEINHGKADIFPHPDAPKNLMDVHFSLSTHAPNATIRIEEKRNPDGWYICGVRETNDKGILDSTLRVDPTLRDVDEFLVIWVESNRSRTLRVKKSALERGSVTAKVVF